MLMMSLSASSQPLPSSSMALTNEHPAPTSDDAPPPQSSAPAPPTTALASNPSSCTATGKSSAPPTTNDEASRARMNNSTTPSAAKTRKTATDPTTATGGTSSTEEKSNSNNPSYPSSSSRRVTIGHSSNSFQNADTNTNMNNNNAIESSLAAGITSFATSNNTNNSAPFLGGTAARGGGVIDMNHNNNSNNFNAMSSDNRRGSMGSTFGNLDEFFGRRPSFGFDMGMDTFFGRRNSTDSSTAALDLAIMEMSRRRYSTAAGAGMGGGGFPSDNINHLGVHSQASMYPHTNIMGLGGMMNHPSTGSSGSATGGIGGGGGAVVGAVLSSSSGGSLQGSQSNESISQRQQQLQQQQRELELRQKELELQRQQLIASMQERSYGSSAYQGGGGGSMMMHRNSFGGLGGSLGLGSVHSQGSNNNHHQHTSPMQHQQQYASSSSVTASQMQGSTGSGGSGRNWWICQVCNSKAFSSHDEAMSHEAVCQEGLSRHRDSMHFLQSVDMSGVGASMGRNFSMGLGGGGGMDTSQRGLSMGIGGGGGGMDNSARGIVSMGMDSSRGGSMGYESSSRNMSLGLDNSSSGGHSFHNEKNLSMGPFAILSHPVPLALPSDKDWLTPLHCFVRGNCVEVFTATEDDVATPSKGKRKPIYVGQIGIRCPHCRIYDSDNGTNRARERGSVYYPTTIASIYNATMNLLQRHLHNCPAVPDNIMRRYETLKADDARSGTSKRYWIESALSLGLVDTENGIRHSALRPPPLPSLTCQQESTGLDVARRNSIEFFGNKSNAAREMDDHDDGSLVDGGVNDMIKLTGIKEDDAIARAEREMTSASPLVSMEDKPYATAFSFHLMGQMQPCVFTEADRLGKRKGLPPGFPGLACRHCFGGYGSGRFFPSSIKTLSDTSKTLNVLHNHMMRCRKCPAEVKELLESLRVEHDEERAKMKFGSQKAFFGRIWDRLHGKSSLSPGMMSPASGGRSPAGKRVLPPQHMVQHLGGYPGMPMFQDSEHSGMSMNEVTRRPSSTEGLEALAAASSPSKRQKLDA